MAEGNVVSDILSPIASPGRRLFATALSPISVKATAPTAFASPIATEPRLVNLKKILRRRPWTADNHARVEDVHADYGSRRLRPATASVVISTAFDDDRNNGNPPTVAFAFKELSEKEIDQLFEAKCKDLKLLEATPDQRERFGDLVRVKCRNETWALSGCGLGPLTMGLLSSFLQAEGRRGVTSLLLGSNRIGDNGAAALAEFIRSKACSLTLLDLSSAAISQVGGKYLLDSLSENCSLSTLLLGASSGDRNLMGPMPMAEGASSLAVNTVLTFLGLDNNGIGSKGMQLLAPGINLNTALRTLDLTSNTLGDRGLTFLSRVLSNASLTHLILGRNQITNAGVDILCEALKEDLFLQSLDLSYNKIGEESGERLGLSIQRNTRLQVLLLRGNQLGSKGLAGFSEAFPIHAPSFRTASIAPKRSGTGITMPQMTCVLRKLVVSNNGIGDEGVLILAGRLTLNTTLETLDLGGNNITDAGATEIGRMLQQNSCLTTLELQKNRIACPGARELGQGILVSARMRTLGLRDNRLDDEAVKQLVHCVKACPLLTSLDVSWNDVSFAQFVTLESLQKENRRRLDASAVPRLTSALQTLLPLSDSLAKVESRLAEESDAKAKVGPETERLQAERAEAERVYAATMAQVVQDTEAAKASIDRLNHSYSVAQQELEAAVKAGKGQQELLRRKVAATASAKERVAHELGKVTQELAAAVEEEEAEVLARTAQLEAARAAEEEARAERDTAVARLAAAEAKAAEAAARTRPTSGTVRGSGGSRPASGTSRPGSGKPARAAASPPPRKGGAAAATKPEMRIPTGMVLSGEPPAKPPPASKSRVAAKAP